MSETYLAEEGYVIIYIDARYTANEVLDEITAMYKKITDRIRR